MRPRTPLHWTTAIWHPKLNPSNVPGFLITHKPGFTGLKNGGLPGFSGTRVFWSMLMIPISLFLHPILIPAQMSLQTSKIGQQKTIYDLTVRSREKLSFGRVGLVPAAKLCNFRSHSTRGRHQWSMDCNRSCQLYTVSMYQSSVCFTSTALPRNTWTVTEGCFSGHCLAKIEYCLPAWSGLCTAADRVRLDSFLRRCTKLRYISASNPPSVSCMLENAEDSHS